MNFNDNQIKAINHINGNIVINAVAGSGKTTVLASRIVNMIENHDINPQNILAITFSKKAKENMSEKLTKLTKYANYVNVETFHSLALRIIQATYGNRYKVWTTQWEKEACVGDVCNTLGLCSKEDAPYNEIMIFITKQKVNMLKPTDELIKLNKMPFEDDEMKNIYAKYESYKTMNNLIEFDDFLNIACDIFKEDNNILQQYQNKFMYILSDEYQDVSLNQGLLIEYLGKVNNNTFIVGDALQCWHGDNKVETKYKTIKLVKDLKIGDIVQCSKKSKKYYSEITNITNKVVGKTIEIETSKGYKIRTSLTHKFFTDEPPFDEGTGYLYLMYRKDKGFRIGITNGGATKTIQARTSSENPDRLWIIERHDSKSELSYFENYYSLKYKIPKIPYRCHGRDLSIDQNLADKIFEDFGCNGIKLLNEKEIDFDCPNYIAQNSTIRITNFYTVKLISSCKNSFEVSYEGKGDRIRKYFSNFKEAYIYANKLKDEFDCDFVFEKMSIKSNPRNVYKVVNASSLTIGMNTLIIENGEVAEDTIISIKIIEEETNVYDIEVAECGNMVANNILSHNCIYGFRGGISKYMLDFDKEWHNVSSINLNKNYRCSADIIDVANKFAVSIPESKHRNYAITIPDKEYFKKPIFTDYEDSFCESNGVSDRIIQLCKENYKYGDVAILARTNAQLQKLEATLHNKHIPFDIVDGRLFTELPEIQLLLSYLRLSVDKNDNDAFRYMYNKPLRWLSKKFLQEVESKTNSRNKSLYDAMFTIDRRNWRFKSGIDEIHDIINSLQNKRFKDTSEMIKYLRKKLTIDDFVSKGNIGDDGLSEQTDNMDSFQDICKEFKTVKELLFYLDDLNKAMDNTDVNQKVKLMTIHKSKGLEFPVVFVVGCSDGLLPHYKTNDINDEKRLLYVAITRAEQELYLSSVRFYNDKVLGISPFINEMKDTINKEVFKHNIKL